MNLNSPIENYSFEGQTFYLKRDDILHPDFSGNKARKFYYFLHNDFPTVEKIVSYGSAQSNAMYSLSVLAKMRGWEFEYFVDHVADYLKDNPHGNYKGALDNGMRLRQAQPPFPECSLNLSKGIEENDSMKFIEHVGVVPCGYPKEVLFIEEGGRQKEAEYGIQMLAHEITEWQKENNIEELNVFLPSGTGTTSLFLQKSFNIQHSTFNIHVYTNPCVGDASYLKEQFFELDEDEKQHPTILSLEKKHHFGKLYSENYKIWLKLHKETGVVFDLLYDPLGWRTLFAHPEVFEKPTLYIHQGGILGNESMLPRYERKYGK